MTRVKENKPPCDVCGEALPAGRRRYCSDACWQLVRNERERVRIAKKRADRRLRVVPDIGDDAPPMFDSPLREHFDAIVDTDDQAEAAKAIRRFHHAAALQPHLSDQCERLIEAVAEMGHQTRYLPKAAETAGPAFKPFSQVAGGKL